MIDTSREEYWTGDSPEDIVEWLRLYSKDDNMDVKPVICHKCPVCKKSKSFNVRVGFSRRDNGSVRWVYIGNRCTGCEALGSYLDWKIDYEPTDKMERGIFDGKYI